MRAIWIFLLVITALPLWGKDAAHGTLVVSYQTGAKGERLDRIRFRLTNKQNEQQSYPRGNGFVSDDDCQNRTVVVENLPVGNYTLEFIVPNFDALFEPVEKRNIEIKSDSIVKVDQFIRPRYASLKAAAALGANTPPFVVLPTITVEDHQRQVRAQSTRGKLAVHYLIPGSYTIIFDPLPGYVTPTPIPIVLAPYENAGPFIGSYRSTLDQPENEGLPDAGCNENTCFNLMHLFFPPLGATDEAVAGNAMGFVTVNSNNSEGRWAIYRGDLRIYSGKGTEIKIPVPRGNRYRLRADDLDGYSFKTDPPSYFAVGPGETTLAEIDYKKTSGRLEIETPLPEGTQVEMTLKSAAGTQEIYILTSSKGKINWSEILPTGEYILTFSPTPPLENPPPQRVKIAADSHLLLSPFFSTPKVLKVEDALSPTNDSLEHTLLTVPAGPVIVGDPFNEGKGDETPAHTVHLTSYLIGAFEVTNSQYASWLNKAFLESKVFFDHGIVTDFQGRLLCKTAEADAYSQMTARQNAAGEIGFQSSPGKGLHPVINVSWFGAMAYCADRNCRLPTEAEWEKAAGMEISRPPQPLRKFRYGFSRDVIDSAWANYKPNDNPITDYQVLTTEVGFYNGINLIPPNADNPLALKTNSARSPVGAYDMSGNVWEWVSDWYQADYFGNASPTDPLGPPTGTSKVAKGGCYDSLAKGVRVAERIALPPEHTDPYTGFRVAKKLTEE